MAGGIANLPVLIGPRWIEGAGIRPTEAVPIRLLLIRVFVTPLLLTLVVVLALVLEFFVEIALRRPSTMPIILGSPHGLATALTILARREPPTDALWYYVAAACASAWMAGRRYRGWNRRASLLRRFSSLDVDAAPGVWPPPPLSGTGEGNPGSDREQGPRP